MVALRDGGTQGWWHPGMVTLHPDLVRWPWPQEVEKKSEKKRNQKS